VIFAIVTLIVVVAAGAVIFRRPKTDYRGIDLRAGRETQIRFNMPVGRSEDAWGRRAA